VLVYGDLATGFEIWLTWHRLDVVGRMHRHHLGVYANAISSVRIETVGYLNKRQWRGCVWVEVVSNRVRTSENVEGVVVCRDLRTLLP
jgi:hypothetical protein